MSIAIVKDEASIPTTGPVAAAASARKRASIRKMIGSVLSAAEWLLGLASILLAMAVLSSIPIGQFLALGYLLEASGRVARTGRLRDGFIGVRMAARWGAIAVAGFLLWLPLYGMSIMAESARIIDPTGPIARWWEFALAALAAAFALHVSAALLRGGRFRDFIRPFNIIWLARRVFRGGIYSESRDRFWAAIVSVRLPYYFWLGLRGFLGAFLWLLIPLLLLAQGHRSTALGVLGGVLLALVVPFIPFLQVRFARDNRFRAFRELRPVRSAFRAAPIAFAVALAIHLLCSIPLYLLKIELIPRDLIFLEGLVFLLFIFPAHLIDGWAYARGLRHSTPRHWLARWLARLAVVPVVVAYVLVVFSSPHLGWHGIASLYEQHAFLLPVPFVTWKS